MTQKREMEKEPKMKRARKAAAKPAAESAPYVEQVSELLMIHNKNDPAYSKISLRISGASSVNRPTSA